MNIVELTKYKAKIEFSIDELTILKNSLTEVHQQFTANDFLSLIHDMSKEESTEYICSIGEIIVHCKKRLKSILKNKISDLIQLVENGVIIELSYKLLLGFNGVLNVVCHGVCLHIQDFKSQIGFEEVEINSLSSTFFDVVEKMGEDKIGNILLKRAREISKSLNIKYPNLPNDLSIPQIRKECRLQLESHLIVFLLFSQNKTRKIFSGIRLLIGKHLDSAITFTKLNVGFIRHDDLVNLVAYLELAVTSATDDTDLKEFILSLSYTYSPLLKIQVLSRSIESEEIGSIKFQFRIYSPIQENSSSNEYQDIEDTLSISNIYSFTSLVREFLCEQSIAQMNAFEAID